MIYALCYMFCMLGVAIIGSYNHMDAFITIWIAAFVLGSFIRIAYFHAKGRARTSDAVFTYIGTVLSLLMLAFYTEIAVGMFEIEDYLIINLLASFLTLIYAIAKDSAKRKKKSDQIHKLSVKSRQISLLTQTLFGGLSYATAVGLAFLYLYFIDVDSGMIIFFIMLLVPLISLILTLIARAGLQTDISASVTQINKDETFVLTISVTKKTVIPAPFIDLVLELPPGIADTDFDTCRIAMSVNKKTDIQLPLKGMISGRANVGLHSVVISD